MGVIDPVLITYVTFVGDELRAFHSESAQLLTRLKKLDEDMAYDHDVVVKVDQSRIFEDVGHGECDLNPGPAD